MSDHSMTASEFNELALRILAAFGQPITGKARCYDDATIRIWEQNDDLGSLKTYKLDVMSKEHRGERPDAYMTVFTGEPGANQLFYTITSVIEHMQRLVLLDVVAGL
jgi:hypothetical protein